MLKMILIVLFPLFCGAFSLKTAPMFFIDEYNHTAVVDALPFQRENLKDIYKTIEGSKSISPTYSTRIIIFDEYFSIESMGVRDKDGPGLQFLFALWKKGKLRYHPYVTEVNRSAARLLKPSSETIVNMSQYDHDVTPDSTRFVYINMEQDKQDTQMQVLRRHDDVIKTFYKSAQSAGVKFWMMYVGKSEEVAPSFIPKDTMSYKYLLMQSGPVLIRFDGMHMVTNDGDQWPVDYHPQVRHWHWTHNATVLAALSFVNFDLNCYFTYTNTNWLWNRIALSEGGMEMGSFPVNVGSSWDQSYGCSTQAIRIVSSRDQTVYTIPTYQVELIRHELNARRAAGSKGLSAAAAQQGKDIDAGLRGSPVSEDTPLEEAAPTASVDWDPIDTPLSAVAEFSYCNTCMTYFPAALLQAYFVVALILLVFSLAMCAFMDLHSNDCFDRADNKVFFGQDDKI